MNKVSRSRDRKIAKRRVFREVFMWTVKASPFRGAHIRNGRIMAGLFFGNFLLHATTHRGVGAMKMNFAPCARLPTSLLSSSRVLSVPPFFVLSSSIRFKRLTFPIIRGHQFTFNSEQYFTDGRCRPLTWRSNVPLRFSGIDCLRRLRRCRC